MKKIILWILGISLLLFTIYALGPAPLAPKARPEIPVLTDDLLELEKQIQEKESKIKGLKPDNEARIIWADSTNKKQTPISLVYIHGFSASQGEGDPIHKAFAKRFGCNLYLARIAEHGIENENPMQDLSADKMIASAIEALEIGKKIGKKVILMSTSTGGTLSLYLASRDVNKDILGLILYSPNIEIYDPNAKLLNKPWGLQIARKVFGSNFRSFEGPPGTKEYWTTRYRMEAIVALQNLVEHTMTEKTFEKITQPVFLAYYYKNEEEQDKVVSIPAMFRMFDQIATPENKKYKIALPTTGNHGMASKCWSKDLDVVRKETFDFAEKYLEMEGFSDE